MRLQGDAERARRELQPDQGAPGSDLAWPNMIRLSPAPPGNIRWLDVAPPYRQALRVALSRGGPHSPDDETQVSVSDAALSGTADAVAGIIWASRGQPQERGDAPAPDHGVRPALDRPTRCGKRHLRQVLPVLVG